MLTEDRQGKLGEPPARSGEKGRKEDRTDLKEPDSESDVSGGEQRSAAEGIVAAAGRRRRRETREAAVRRRDFVDRRGIMSVQWGTGRMAASVN